MLKKIHSPGLSWLRIWGSLTMAFNAKVVPKVCSQTKYINSKRNKNVKKILNKKKKKNLLNVLCIDLNIYKAAENYI